VDCAAGRAPCLKAKDDSGYEIDEAEVVYWGRCPECQGRSRKRAQAAAPRAAKRKGRHP